MHAKDKLDVILAPVLSIVVANICCFRSQKKKKNLKVHLTIFKLEEIIPCK